MIMYHFPRMLFLSGVFLLQTTLIIAQKDTSRLEFNQIEVIKSFEIKLKDAERIETLPVLPVPEDTKLNYKYMITPVPINIQYPDPEIRALAMQQDDPYPVHDAFIKAGYGNRKSPLLQGGIHKVRKDIYHWGAVGKYESANDNQKILNHDMSNINLDVFGSYVWKNNLKLGGNFENRYKSRVLWNENTSLDSIFSQRHINTTGLHVNLANIDLSPYKLNYFAQAGFTTTRLDDQKSFEQGIQVQGMVEKHRSKNSSFVLNLDLDMTFLKSENWKSLVNLTSSPHFIFKIGKFRALAGLAAIISNDKHSIFPKTDLSYPILQDHVQLFIGSDLKVFTNNLYHLTKINPYINTRLPGLTNTLSREMFGGIKGEYSFLSYQVSSGYKIVDNHTFFQVDSADQTRFAAGFRNTDMVFISGNLDFKILKNVSVGGWLTQNIIVGDSARYLLHVPNLSLQIYGKATFLEEKLKISTGLLILDGYRYNTFNNEKNQEGPLFDLNIQTEYYPFTFMGIFLKGSNLLNSNFQRWQGYSQLGIQVHGGLVFIF